MDMIISRDQALAAGRTTFYTGKPCSKGHDACRYVSTGNCTECHKVRARETAKTYRVKRTAKLRGVFTVQAHPDDFAALFTYAQALALNRGQLIQPDVREATPTPRSREQIAEDRRRILGAAADLVPALDQWGVGSNVAIRGKS